MTRQEKIREEMKDIIREKFILQKGGRYTLIDCVDDIFKCLHSQGLVIKVKKESPCPKCDGSGLIEVGELRGGVFRGSTISCPDCKGTGKASYVAFEPLI